MITPLAALRSRSSVKAADVVVYRDGDYAVAVDKFGNEIARSTDHAEVWNLVIDKIECGRIIGISSFDIKKPIYVNNDNLKIEGGIFKVKNNIDSVIYI